MNLTKRLHKYLFIYKYWKFKLDYFKKIYESIIRKATLNVVNFIKIWK